MAKLPDNYADYAGMIEDALYELETRTETTKLEIENAKAGLLAEIDRHRDRATKAQLEAIHARKIGIRARNGAQMTMDTGWYHEIRRRAMEECRKVLTSMVGESFEFGTDPLQVAERRLSELAELEELAMDDGMEGRRTYRALDKDELPPGQHFNVQMEFTLRSDESTVITEIRAIHGERVTRYVPVEVIGEEYLTKSTYPRDPGDEL